MEDNPEPKEIPKERDRESQRRVKYAYWPEDVWLEPYWPYWDESASKPKRRRKRRALESA